MASNSATEAAEGHAADPAGLAERLGHGFSRPELLERALTHPSAASRRDGIDDSYERLEFLGDRVVGLIVADLLLARFPHEPEGALAVRHAELVRREKLSALGRLAAGVAHDVRNPLHSISLTLQHLRETCRPAEPRRAEEFDRSVEIIRGEVRRLDQTVGNLSGGNQQKVSIAKWLAAEADILIFDEPTIGIDIKTKDVLHELIWELAASGKAILLISSDMPEMVRLADRILVMKGGRIVAEIENSRRYDEVSEEIMKDLA